MPQVIVYLAPRPVLGGWLWPREVRQVSKVFDKSTFLCKTKPISLNVQMNLRPHITRVYDVLGLCDRVKNKAKTKPNKANFAKCPNEHKAIQYKEICKKRVFCLRKNKANQSQFGRFCNYPNIFRIIIFFPN